MTTKPISILIIFLLVLSCSIAPDKIAEFKVEYKGALKNMMRKGDISAKIDLINFQNTQHFYALGAVEDLKGEIFIQDSKPFISYVDGNELLIDHSFNFKATLLVYTSVENWLTFEIPESVKSHVELEDYIQTVAKNNGINTATPFPFQIEGKAKSFDWHVINWKEGDMEHTHEKHINSGLKGTLNNQDIEILGFYSDRHHTIFTHHTTNMHMHVKTTNNKISGHLDALKLGNGMVLKLPAPKT